MAAYVSVLRAAKDGSTERECEDATAVLPVTEPDRPISGPVFAAICDGASESALARDWAAILSTGVVDAIHQDARILEDRGDFAAALMDAGARWSRWLERYLARRDAHGPPIAWYERPKFDQGAYATVLAAHFVESARSGSWHAAALGDSCLFHVRNNLLKHAFPMDSAASFGNTPNLINSRNQDHHSIAKRVELTKGDLEQGDQFLLCTDALAAWFLAEAERDNRPWETLCDFTRCDDHDGLADWLGHLRSTGRMRNDDVAVIHVDLG